VDEKEYTPETINDADVKILPIIHKGCGEKKQYVTGSTKFMWKTSS